MWFIALSAMFMCYGCSTPSRLGSNADKPYLWEPLPHHPQLAWHRHHPDSATVYVRLPAHEPLHLREDSDAPFRFSLELELLVAATEWPTGNQESRPNTMLHRFRWEDAANPDRRELVGRFTFPLSTGRYRIIHTIRDLHRGSDVTGVTAFDGWGNNAPERCLAFELATGEPAWNRSLPDGGRCGLLVPPDMIDLPWRHTAMPPVDSFPSAPFLDRIPKALSFPEDKSAPQRPIPVTEVPSDVFFPAGNWTGWSWVSWENAPGIHRWSYGDDSSSILVAARRRHFPVMRDLDQMIRATRYIATRQEYKTMRNARDPKKALDEFWLSFAPGPDVARGLIATYYGRVREANVHFTSLKEGWCTDRGMVHMVFGHADRVRRDFQGETWVYGEEGDVNALIFRFSRNDNGDDFNRYDLERYPGFRSPWEAMVSSWRRGKVRNR